MDRITANLLAEFCSEYGFSSLATSDQFEHFVNFAILSASIRRVSIPSDVHAGAGGGPGIHGLGIVVNGALVSEEEEVDDSIQSNNYLDVAYIFTQAKTSSNFEGAEVG